MADVNQTLPVVIKAGSENPHPQSGITYPIAECLDRIGQYCRVIVTEDEDEQSLIRAVRGATILMITYGLVSRKVIEVGQPTLKAIIKMGTGIDSIDFAAARDNNVRVTNCPQYADRAVAENAFMLLINCMKKFIAIHHGIRKSGWVGPTEENKSLELYGKSVGLIGFGHINSKLAGMCMGFGMKVYAFDPYVSAKTMETKGVDKIGSLDAIAASCDVISLCVPLNEDTRAIIDKKFLERMKPSAFLINVGRGATVDETALLAALENRIIAGCGLDVFSQEPLTKSNHPLSKLLTMDNVVISPHLAAWTKETWDRLQCEIEKHVVDILECRDTVIHSNDPRLANQPDCVYPD